ncbi:MAG: hypothetical protein RR764_04155, partial [Oscillospiraceae bacterium]
VSLSVAKEIHYVVIRYRALGACSYLALLYAWTNAVISTVIYIKNKALQSAINYAKCNYIAKTPRAQN